MAKPRKVEESAGAYQATSKTPDKLPAGLPGIRFAKVQDVRKTNEKLMQVHRKVLQKLAQ